MRRLFCLACALAFALPVVAAVPDHGDFRLRFEPPKSKELRELANAVRDSNIFFEVFKAINETIALPRNVPVVFRECGEENAAYDSETNQIDVCYEMIARFGKIFASDKDNSADQIGKYTLEATMFIAFHETGHALVHQLDLPITGREEDAVDDLAGIIALHLGEGSEEVLLAAIQAFADFAREEESGSAEDLAFWDEHSLSSQRVYSIACMLVGMDPKTFSRLVGDDALPQERAEKCPDEFTQKSNSWNRLLEPYFKGEPLTVASAANADEQVEVVAENSAEAEPADTSESEPQKSQGYSRPFQSN